MVGIAHDKGTAEIHWDQFCSIFPDNILVLICETELGHTMTPRFCPVSAEGVCGFSPCLCETETVVKPWPTQSRCHRAPNNDLNVMTDDTQGVWMQHRTDPKLHLLLCHVKGEKKETCTLFKSVGTYTAHFLSNDGDLNVVTSVTDCTLLCGFKTKLTNQ